MAPSISVIATTATVVPIPVQMPQIPATPTSTDSTTATTLPAGPLDTMLTVSTTSAASNSTKAPPPTLVGQQMHWYDNAWVTPAAVGLFLYSCFSLVLLMWLCVGGRLDTRLNITPSHRRRRRVRQLRETHGDWTRGHVQRQNRSNSITTVMGNGDEADIAATRAELQSEGIYLSERTLRQQRLRHQELNGDRRITTFPDNWLDLDQEYEPTEEEMAEARRLTEHRIRLVEERRRARADAQVMANMRSLGML